MDLLKQLIAQVRDVYKGMTSSQKLSVFMLTSAVVIALVLGLVWGASSGDFEVLFFAKDMMPEQTADIMRKLNEQNIETKIINGDLHVPSSKRQQALGMLTAENMVPSDIVMSFDAFVKASSFGKPSDKLSKEYKFALEQELQKTLNYMPGIQRSKVVVSNISDGMPFKKKSETKCGVVVFTAANKPLEKKTAEGIRAFVSAAVQDLAPENVKITDAISGKVFVKRDPNDPDAGSSDKDERNFMLAGKYEEMIEGILSNMYSNVAVTVNVELDYDKDVYTKETPTEPQDYIKEKSKETSNDSTNGGSAGNVPNNNLLGPKTEGTTESKISVSRETSRTVMSAPGKEFIERVKELGKIKNLGIIIYANKEGETAKDESGNEVIKYNPIPEEEQKKVSAQLAAVLGNKATVQIITGTKSRIIEKQIETGWDEFKNFMGAHGSTLALAFLGMIALLTIRSTILRVLPERAMKPVEVKEPDMPDLSDLEPPEDSKLVRSRHVQERVQQMVEDSPEKAAGIIKRWIMREG